MIPNPAVINKLSSISVGTITFLGLLKLVVKAVAVAVSLYAGRGGMIGFEVAHLAAVHVAVLYSRMAVVVVLSNGAPCALAYARAAM